MQIYKIIRSCIIQVRIIYCFLRETTRIITLTSDIRHQPSDIRHHPSAIVHATDPGISNPLVLPSVNLCECKKFFELLYPLRLQLPSIQRFTIRLQPVEHIMLFYSMLRWVAFIRFNELLHFIIPIQPTCILIHLTSYFLLIPCSNHLPVHNLPEGSEMSSAAVLIIQIIRMLPNIERQ